MRRIILLLSLAAMALTGWMEYRRSRRPSAQGPLHLVLASAGGRSGMTPLQRQGFGLLFKDCLEYGSGLAVVDGEAAGVPGETLTVDVAREGNGARLRLALFREGLQARRIEIRSANPRGAVVSALRWLGLEGRPGDLLLPGDPGAFWDLLSTAALGPADAVGPPMEMCARILVHEPECVGALLTRARLGERRVRWEGGSDPGLQEQCERDFAGALALAPECPRAVAAFARFRTNLGDPRAAMTLIFESLDRKARAPRLFETLAYAARNAGLLEGASLALARLDQLGVPGRAAIELTEDTHLYLGQLDRFEGTLGRGSEDVVDTLRDFHRGYVRLLKGDRDGAAPFFDRAGRGQGGIRRFQALARVYRLALAGDDKAALTELRRLWQERLPIRMPDGEFTFKVAEAFGFLGCAAEAQDAANRAFAQGFSCTRWYRESPFLACMRATPRWVALEQHLKERQELMEASFPRERFTF